MFYREHWRHVQYDTDEQIAEDFFHSVDYADYLSAGLVVRWGDSERECNTCPKWDL